MGWLSPTGHIENSGWRGEDDVYDKDFETWAGYRILPLSWSPFLVLTISPVIADKLRFDAFYHATTINRIDIDVFKDGGWVDVYSGSYLNHTWVEKTFPSGEVTMIRARFRNDSLTLIWIAQWYECELWAVFVSKGAMQTGKYWGEPI